MGGRVEPFGSAMTRSAAEVPYGEQFVPGSPPH